MGSDETGVWQGQDGTIAPGFDIDLFVLPRWAYHWLLSRVKKWEAARLQEPIKDAWRIRPRRPGLAPGDQVLSLTGERGAGKTWFLHYLAGHDPRTAPLAVYLDLERRVEYAAPEGFVRATEDRILARCGRDAAILLLDAVPPHLDEPLRALEEAVLRPHLAHRASLVIMALEHPSQACWRAPSLRGGESCALLPFAEAQAQDQIRRLQQRGLARALDPGSGPDLAAGGLPLLNYLLATHEPPEAFALLLEHWFSRIPVDDRERVYHYLVAVSTLDILEQVWIERMLEVYVRCFPDAVGFPVHASGVKNVLQKYWLARPLPGSPGRIALVASVRHAASELLKLRDPGLYAVLDEMAQVLRESSHERS